ncbi:MAG: hypothetical protein CMF50_04095 [Legionellales bacterium]|nr:hypothetical protein [Legionellales bacterium]|tara:strand:+ start:20564 stop:21292 length:729 start_codon:yes stop_codon:yes gene_type:complete
MNVIQPNWPAPANIHGFTTTRLGGVSEAPYDSFNLGDHVGDSEAHVSQNRQLLAECFNLPSSPIWLRQIHSPVCVKANASHLHNEADGSYSRTPGEVCAVLTADCLPILICNKQGSEVAALHGGWRGLFAGIIANALTMLDSSPEELLVWLGPAIGPNAFEVGPEVRDNFISLIPTLAEAFKPGNGDRWYGDIYGIARQQCQALGITAIYGGNYCTVSTPDLFYSYRRDGTTGRMASLIWMT